MPKIRVLVVDDAVVVRRFVSDTLAEDPDIEVVAAAAHGRIAMAKIPEVNPDLVTLDVEMPEMDGIETLKAIREKYPMLPVIMFSTLTERGARATLDALTAGASDYVTKPANVGSVTAAIEQIREQLIPKVKALCASKLKVVPATLQLPPPPHRSITEKAKSFFKKPRVPTAPIRVVVIGVSTGGPNALATLVADIPGDFPVPVLIVQHMPPMFTKMLADRLSTLGDLPVREAIPGAVVEPGTIWVAPGGFHMAVESDGPVVRLVTNQDPPENSCRPAVDILFRFAAQVYGSGVLAAVLTGMGRDGLRGCERVRERDGYILVQDVETSVVWGMPGFVAEANLADRILPIGEIGPEIVRKTIASREQLYSARA